MTTTTSTAKQPAPYLSSRRRAGHLLGVLLGLIHLSVLGIPTGSRDAGPPLPVLILGAAIGLAVIALLVRSWRQDAPIARWAAGVLLVLAALGVLPGLLVANVALALRLAAGALVGLTVATLVLLFLPESGTDLGVAR